MQVDEKLISYLEDLSCLALSDNEKKSLAGDLQGMLSVISKISEVNTDGVPEDASDKVNVFREDEVHPSLPRELILQNAPERNDEMFIAPRTVE